MTKAFRPYTLDQQLAAAPDLRQWLPEGDLALFISDVDELDLSGIYQSYETGEGRGQPPYDPAMMVKILLYALLHGPAVVAEDRARDLSRCRHPCVGRRPASRPRQPGRVPPAPSAGTGRAVRARPAAVPGRGLGEIGPCGAGRDQGAGQRLQAQGDELCADDRNGATARAGSPGAARSGGAGRCGGRSDVTGRAVRR